MSRDTLGKQLLITRKQQIEATGHGKRKFVGLLFLLAADITHASPFLRTALEQGTNEALGRTDIHRMFGKDGTQGFFIKTPLTLL